MTAATLRDATLSKLSALGAAALAPFTARWELSRAKHPSLTGHVRMAKRLSKLIPFYAYDDATIFAVDGAPADVEARRRDAFARLTALYETRFAQTNALSDRAAERISDLQFTRAYRVPFQFSALASRLRGGAFWRSTQGVTATDLDGNVFYDLTGSYGVNLFGSDFYKTCIAQAAQDAAALGPVLGAYHPIVADNAERIARIAGQDEVSFHMSGTEAVMQAVRLARHHTGRRRLVRFCGAYHGWWGDVAPGVGNPTPARDTFTLAEMSARSLRVLARRRDIACVLVNPLQALHPNAGAPSDSTLVAAGRGAGFDRAAYAAWLRDLRAICTRKNIALIFDEVFVGFRLGVGGAQAYFDVRADLVAYGKTLGGGLPIGVVCGGRAWMRRFDEARPLDICFARGTFNAHPYVMCAMNRFLRSLDEPERLTLLQEADATWSARAAQLNDRLSAAVLPVRVANLSSIWTVLYQAPSRYNWMLQFYLRAEGLALSWVGTGRLIFSLDYDDAAFEAVAGAFVAAAAAMARDGWFWSPPDATSKSVARGVLREIVATRLGRPTTRRR